MSTEGNVMFKAAIREKMGKLLTCAQMDSTMAMLDEIMCDYEIERNRYEDTGKDFMLEAYIEAKRVEGLSEKTLQRYEWTIKRMLEALGVNTRNINAYHIRKYLASEKERGLKDTSLKGLREVLCAYFGWLHRDGLIPMNIMANIGKIKCAKVKKEGFTEIEVHRIIGACKNLRDRTIVHVLRSTGCRVSELTGMNRKDINGDKILVTGKGNKQRIVYLDQVATEVVKEYLKTRRDLEEPLFINRYDRRIEPNGIRMILKDIERRTGIPKIHPHRFRRTQITALVNKGMQIEQVARLAGHEKIDTTMKYVNVDEANVENAFHRYA